MVFVRILETLTRVFDPSGGQRDIDQRLLLGPVKIGAATGRRRGRCAAGITERLPVAGHRTEVVLDLVPGTLVSWFFLAPDDL